MDSTQPLRRWRTAARPPAPEAALQWLRHPGTTPSSAPSQQQDGQSATQAAAAVSAGAARLIGAPHQPRISKWGAFAGGVATYPQQQAQAQAQAQEAQQQQSSGGSAPVHEAAPTWPSNEPPYALPAPAPTWRPAGASDLRPAGASWGARSNGAPPNSRTDGGGRTDGAAPVKSGVGGWGSMLAAPAAALGPGLGAPHPPFVREGSNSPVQVAAPRQPDWQPTVYPPDLPATSSRPMSRAWQQHPLPLEQPPNGYQPPAQQQPPPQQHQQQQQQQPFEQGQLAQPYHQPFPQCSAQISTCGTRSHGGGGRHPPRPVAPARTDSDSWQAAPTAAQLLYFVEQQGLGHLGMDEVMRVWREQGGGGHAVSGFAPPAPLAQPAQEYTQPHAQEQPGPGSLGGTGWPQQQTQQAQQQARPLSGGSGWQAQQQQQQQQQQQKAQPAQPARPQQQAQQQQAQVPQQPRPLSAEGGWQHFLPAQAPLQQQAQRPASQLAGRVPSQRPQSQRTQQLESASAQQPKLRQAVLVNAFQYAAPEPEQPAPSAWQPKQAGVLQALTNHAPPPTAQGRKSSAAGNEVGAGAGSAGAGGSGAGGSKEEKKGRGKVKRGGLAGAAQGGAAAAAAAGVAFAAAARGAGSDSDFEEPGAASPPAQKPAKRQRKTVRDARPALPSGPAAAPMPAPVVAPGKQQQRQAASVAAAAAAVAEVLDLGPWNGVVDACTPLGFTRFASDMEKAPQCSVGLLQVDPSGRQFFSSLEPLTKQQQQAIKAAAAAAAGGSKKARASGKGKGTGKAAAAAAELAAVAGGTTPAAAGAAAASTSTPGKLQGSGGQVVGLCVLPINVNPGTEAGVPAANMYFVPLAAGTWGGLEVAREAAAQGTHVAQQLLGNPAGAVIAFNLQSVLRLVRQAGMAVPMAHRLEQLIDPRLLAWLLEPHLLQGSAKELIDYSLAELESRHLGDPTPGTTPAGVGAGAGAGTTALGGEAPLAPLQRMRRALTAAMLLGEVLIGRLSQGAVPMEAVIREMQVASLLAQMEGTGLGFDPWTLTEAGQAARASMARIEGEAASLVGRPFNLSSPQQLAEVLYSHLKLPHPTMHGRASAKTHLPTDEAALKQLRLHSPLPALVLEYRALQNFVSKWVQADWVQAAAGGFPSAEAFAQAHGGGGGSASGAGGAYRTWPRVYCSWNQTCTATGRLSSSAPNLQAVTKYQVEAAGGGGLNVCIRDAFVAPQGCLLLSADYSQVELRVLAHLSGDPALIHLLKQAGPAGDAFNYIAHAWLGAGDVARVSEEDREKAKRVTYGLIYGLTAWGLSQGSGALGITQAAAQDLINSFLSHFKGVAAWIEQTKVAARAAGGVTTLAGRQRPIKGLTSNDQRVRTEAERKAVNGRVQGSAADLMKQAMVGWCQWWEQHEQPPVRILAQLHDELLLEVDASLVDAHWVAQELQRVMEVVGSGLRVPLVAKVKMGERWGSLAAVE